MAQIVKLGGSVLTEKGGEPVVREDVLERLAGELAGGGEELFVVHGAGSFGHPLAQQHGLVDGVDSDEARSAAARVHADVRRLALRVLGALGEAGLDPVTLSPFGTLSCNDGRPGGWNLVPLHRMLATGFTPVSYGDLVLDTTRGMTVLSGDTIVAEAARFLQPERVIFALDQDGVYDQPPSADGDLLERPTRETLTEARDACEDPDAPDVTGGMAGKLTCALGIQRAGVDVAFVNGLVGDRLARALEGDVEGTLLDGGEPT